jgi:hypothetical protein
MPRSRNIKPGFFTNEVLAECSVWARLCFAGLWMLADREGRLEDRPKRIKGELFRFDNVDVDPLLVELERHGFLVRYANEDGRFIQILAFKKHQTPHYSEKASTIKPPRRQEHASGNLPESGGHDEADAPGGLPEDSQKKPPSRGGHNPLIPDSLIPDSLIPDSLIPEEEGRAGARAPPRGTALRAVPPPTPPPAFEGDSNATALNGKAVARLAAGWELPTQWGLDAEALGWKRVEVLREAERFRQYWTTGAGQGTRRSVKGWRQTWSNWLGKAERMQR